MRRIALATLVIGLAACERAPTAVPEAPAAPRLRAVSFTDSERLPLDIVAFVPCANGGAGEEVLLSGTLHVLFHVTESSAGNFHIKTHNQPQGVGGVGLTTGTKYRGTGVTQDQFHINGTLPLVATFVNNFRIIGQGPGNNFTVHENLHVTINARGVVTASVDNFRTACR